jgi:hypothetical protein
MNIGKIMTAPTAPRIPLKSRLSQPAPNAWERSGMNSTARRTLTR